MNKKIDLFRPIIYLLTIVCVCMAITSAMFDTTLFYINGAIVVVAGGYVLFQLRYAGKEIDKFMGDIGRSIGQMQSESSVSFPLPVFMVTSDDEIVWHNEQAARLLPPESNFFGHPVSQVVGELDFRTELPEHGFDINFLGKRYSMYTNTVTGEDGSDIYALYLVDDNDLKFYADEYRRTRPSVLIITIDNYEELAQSAKDSERSLAVGEIEYLIEQFAEAHQGIISKIEKDRFVVTVEERHMETIVEGRFSILDQIRSISAGDRVPSTLSIGVSRGAKDLSEAYQHARQALDMALGRGGDQAAVRTQNGYDFYGGVSKGVEKRTKVKTRIIANALSELIESSDHVILMGHSFADLDCFGSAVGLCRAVVQMGKPAHIAIDSQKNLVGNLYDRLLENGYEGLLLDPIALMDTITGQTLLIIVDTHTENMVESAELYRKCENVVVIDHHRRMVNHINNAVIFYHEPFASSAAEMVTELVQYFGEDVKLGRIEAEALLSGIMLDTKNFVIKTGVRTFEAAAYLRRLGADTVEVRKLFSSTMDAYQRRSRLVGEAEIYRGCAIATAASPTEDIKVVAPQAADELLGISDVDASFVLYEYEGGVSYSARSMGEMNVQIVMEKLGGGGHLTMAGAQIEGITLEDARQRLLAAIDEFREQETSESA